MEDMHTPVDKFPEIFRAKRMPAKCRQGIDQGENKPGRIETVKVLEGRVLSSGEFIDEFIERQARRREKSAARLPCQAFLEIKGGAPAREDDRDIPV
jgi:hypothetical protein